MYPLSSYICKGKYYCCSTTICW